MSEKGTGMCQACGAQKKKCLKTHESTWKMKKTASAAEGSSCETSKSLQGWDRADTLCTSMSAMHRLTVLDAVEIRSLQCTMQVQKHAPSVEGAGALPDSGSSAKRQREHLPVCETPHLEDSPGILLPTMHWDSPDDGDDVQMDTADEVPQGQMGESPQMRRGVEVRSHLWEQLVEIGAELKHLEEALFDEHKRLYGEKVRAEAECKQVEEEWVCASEATCSIAHMVICLQRTVMELEAEAREW